MKRRDTAGTALLTADKRLKGRERRYQMWWPTSLGSSVGFARWDHTIDDLVDRVHQLVGTEGKQLVVLSKGGITNGGVPVHLFDYAEKDNGRELTTAEYEQIVLRHGLKYAGKSNS